MGVVGGAELDQDEDGLELTIEFDEPLTGDIEKDAKYLWLELHKRLLEPHLIIHNDGKRARVFWGVKRAKS